MTEYRALMDGDEIANKVWIANTFIKRFKGLIFKNAMEEEEGLLINPCSQVHTIGMKFNIDVVYLSKSGEVLETEAEMIPGIVGPFVRKCHQVLELKSGTVEKKCIMKGKRIAFDPIFENSL